MVDLSGHTLFERVYEGSESVLYRGRRDGDGAPVVVKMPRSEFPTARELARLRREFAILRDTGEVPGVVRAYALEKCGRGLALVMEDLGPSSLHALLKASRLDVGAALRIAIALAGTLDALHGLRIIHKDIKPHNILIDEETRPRLVDFGIAARVSRETPKAAPPDAIEGTLSYIAPEQTGLMNRSVDVRADLYSFGVTLYEMLTGVLPFQEPDPIALIHSHMARTPAPPHERAPGVPRVLSEIVMKLLAKTPEERYQSARGVQRDLEECLRRWQAAGGADPFPLGQHDRPLELRVPQRLYGRAHEVDALLSAFHRARRGAAGLVLISGYSGVGKTALVNEIHKPIARHGGYFAKGKFDPIHRSVALTAVAQAFRELVRQILAEPAAAVEEWKRKLLAAVGANGQLLMELIPELELLLGPQPDVPALGPSEARNRFDLLVQRFVRVFASSTRPLTLFLDDLQWVDPASLRILERLVTDVEGNHVLIIGTYRDNEVDAAHPLHATLEELRKAGVALTEITLKPLDLPTATQIVADTLSAPPHAVAPLAALVFEKTEGNPFFLGQLLGALHEAGALWFDEASEAWAWDVARVRDAVASDNVVDLMLDKLHRLPPATQRALELAACLGHVFDLATLATVHQKSPAATAADLWGALREGLIVPLDNDYRLFDESAGAEPSALDDIEVSYRFLHDRVRHAAYSLVDPPRKEAVHLAIGRLLWARAGEAPPDDDLLEIVRHLDLGARGIADEAERVALARLNLRAGRAAKTRTAYQAAASHFSAGLDLLGDAGWARHEDLCFTLSRENAECVYLSGAPERAEQLFTSLMPRARSNVERAQIYSLRALLHATLGSFEDVVRLGEEGLGLLGFTLPTSEAEAQACFGAELTALEASLSGRRIEDLIDAPVMDNPEQRALLQLISDMMGPIFCVRPELYPLLVLKQVNISLQYGNSDVSAFGYAGYGFLLAVLQGRPAEGRAFGQLALALTEKLSNPSAAARVSYVFATYSYRFERVRDGISRFMKALPGLLETGDLAPLGQAWTCMVSYMFTAGYRLDELREELERGLVVVQRTRDAGGVAVMTLMRQAIANLQGRTRSPDSLSDEHFDEDEVVARLKETNLITGLFFYALIKLQLPYLYGDCEGAAANVAAAEAYSAGMLGLYQPTKLHFYACLALLALPAAASPEEAGRRAQTVARHKERIAGLAASAPMNYEHLLLIIQAEEARGAGDQLEAMRLYDRAISLAREHEFPHDEALANELCAKLHLHEGRTKVARAYMVDAYLGYRHWGATAKADALARDHAALLPSSGDGVPVSSIPSATSGPAGTAAAGTILGRTTVGNLRDAALIVRAVQGIAGETELERIIERLVMLVLGNAGAQRGALLLSRDERLFVEATFGVEPGALALGPSEPLDARDDLPRSVARFVARTREPLVLDDAGADARFSGDPYVVGRRTRSVLCLPLLHQGRLSGVLYLENNAATGAFNASRVELLALLSSQAAISIENATLLSAMRAAKEQVLHVNRRLEAEVAQRTEELQRSNAQLTASNERLQVELAQREQAERERAELQRQMFEAQQAMLAELSTPLIPITDRIMVMPLIGTMDAARAAQVLEVALDGAQRHQASVVILDITGMRHIDTHVAGTLVGTASALRLLGTEAVLTGIRPEVAQAMVSLDIDMKSIVTMGTLQSGIAYALRRSGQSTAGTAPLSAGPARARPLSR